MGMGQVKRRGGGDGMYGLKQNSCDKAFVIPRLSLSVHTACVRSCVTQLVIKMMFYLITRLQKPDPTAEMVMLERMFIQAEREKLEKEKKQAAEEPGNVSQINSQAGSFCLVYSCSHQTLVQ